MAGRAAELSRINAVAKAVGETKVTMTKIELPILDLAAFRKFPTSQAQQEYGDYRDVCRSCISGGCCSSEDPVYLTSFDVFRLSAFFNMSPAEFMLSFTQEHFGDPESDEGRRRLVDDPDCSIVTYLRRRENSPTSPCIFLKYIRDSDGTPRRICSVYDARPLACREFYFTHCRTRVTGELASLHAEGFEKLRDGEMTESMVDAELAAFGNYDPETATLSTSMEYFFWVEMKRAINMEQANVEGADSYDMFDCQDSIDVKINRVLSSKYLRFEEKYGPRPRDEQLTPYAAGSSFAGSAEYERIIKVLREPPTSGLYALGNYPFYAGVRASFPGAQYSSAFSVIPDAEINHFIRSVPRVRLFQHHDLAEVRSITLRDVYASVLRGYNHLIRFASYVATMGNILEDCEPGFIESELFLMIAGFETSLNAFIAENPYLQPIKHYTASAAIDYIERRLFSATSPAQLFDNLRFLCRAKSAVPSLPADLRSRFESAAAVVDARLQKGKLALYLSLDNPIAIRQQTGKRLNVVKAWSVWYDQVLDVRYAAMSGFRGIDLPGFYRRSVDDLEKIPFRTSYALDLYDMVYNLACSISFHNTISCQETPYKDTAERLAAFAVRLFNCLEDAGQTSDCDIIAGFISPIYRGLGLSYDGERTFGIATYRVLNCQLPDGSWQTDPLPESAPDTQEEYLCTMYRSTWACLDALRPLRTDISNPENAALRLV